MHRPSIPFIRVESPRYDDHYRWDGEYCLTSAGEGPSIVDAAAQRSRSVALSVIERVKIVRRDDRLDHDDERFLSRNGAAKWARDTIGPRWVLP